MVQLDLVLERCRIRIWRHGDGPSLVRHANNHRVWINLRDSFPHPYTMADAERWIGQTLVATVPTSFAIAVGDEAVGGIGVRLQEDVYRRSAELGYWLGETFWGRGIATEAVRAMTAYALEAFGLNRLYAGVFEWNEPSMRVLEKAGYVCEGRLRRSVVKDGRTIDSFLYAFTVEEGLNRPGVGGIQPADGSPSRG